MDDILADAIAMAMIMMAFVVMAVRVVYIVASDVALLPWETFHSFYGDLIRLDVKH